MTDIKIHTLELGRVYEEQGYFKKAADHFSGALNADPENPTLIEALDRISVKKNDVSNPIESIERASLSGIVEQWVRLLILRQRAERFAHKLEQ